MSIIIEKVKPADASGLIEHSKRIGGETDNMTFGAEGKPTTVEAEIEYLTKIENSSDNVIFVAKEDGKIIGDASLRRMARRMSHRCGFGMAVAKAYWNRGIGGQLLTEIIKFAKENAFGIIELQVRSDNLSAIHLYEKFGFKKICTYPAFLKIGDNYIDADYMCLSLI